ncbi:MAG: hypothetical protein CME60_07610 [Halobacteriovoraceae bacterium]|nr:hypothetical protein [Halobacteriovoraceae bacterium]
MFIFYSLRQKYKQNQCFNRIETMPLKKKIRTIISGIDFALWAAMIMLLIGSLLSFYYGNRLEKTTNYTLKDQSVILRTLSHVEKVEILLENHFYITDPYKEKSNHQEIRNLRNQIEVQLNYLASKRNYPRFKLLNRRWVKEVNPLVDLLALVEKDHVDFSNLEDFLTRFRKETQSVLNDNVEIKSFEIEKLKLIRLFALSLISLSFIILLKRLFIMKFDLITLNDYLYDLLKGSVADQPKIKERSIFALKEKMDLQYHKLELQDEKIRDYLHFTQETFIVCRTDFTVLSCTKEIKKLLGWESFEVENKKLNFILNTEGLFEELELKYYQNAKKLFNISFQCLSSRGEMKEILGTFLNYYDKVEQKNKIIVVLKDGSGEKKIEELREKSKQLFHNSKMASLGEMSGSIAHEINNPLMIMKGSLSRLNKILIREGHLSEKVEKIIERLSRVSERISSIMFVMQSFGNQNDKVMRSMVDLEELIESHLSLNQEKLKSLGIEVKTSYIDTKVEVLVHRADIDQILQSLVTNAYEAISRSHIEQGVISFKMVYDEGRLFILFRNNGAAISKDVASKLFDPFYTTKTNGIGMGLSIAHSLCQRNDIDLKLDCLKPVTFRLEFLGAVQIKN